MRATATRHASTEPDDLDLRRADNTPLSFGWGIHHCIGAPLARMEGEIAFNALLERFPTIELTGDESHWRPSFTLRGLLDLPLRVNRRRRPVVPTLPPGGPMADASGPIRST